MSGSPINLNSITRRLTSILIAAVVLVVVLVGGGIYWYNVSSNEQAFVAKIDGTLTNLRDALSKPLWNIDNPGVKQLGDAMLQSDLVVSVVVRDDGGKSIFSASNDSSEETVLRTIPIHYRQAVVGELQLKFSREPLYRENQRDLTVLAAWGGILLLFGLWIWRLNTEMKLRKRTEKELLRSKKKAETANQAKSIFLANMSHELRTPLNAILGFSEMLGRDRSASIDQQEKIGIINRSGEHLLEMINDVLDLSKIEAGHLELEPEVFDLPRLLQDIDLMFESRAENKQLRFELVLDSELIQVVKSDAGKLRQILINLLGNAVKFTTKGGITLRARTQFMVDDPAMATLQLEVQDSGPGIAKEQLQSIFVPFVQAGHTLSESKGTGLGLAITKSFVDLLGGEISVESSLGEGSLFRVELPVAVAKQTEMGELLTVKPTVLGLEADQSAWRVLVVEDDLENRLLLTSQLREVGFEVREAENGEEAVKQFEQWQPHFIWMDISMPVMDGYQATAKIRSLSGGDKVKIVALTASVFKEQRQSILEAGCDEVVLKPYQVHKIFNIMEQLLGVRYRYEEQVETKHVTPSTSLNAELLRELPVELRDALTEAAHRLDIKATTLVINRVRMVDSGIADGLQALVESYQFREILNKLKKD